MRLKNWIVITCVLCSVSAQAGPYSDDLAKCLVESTSKEDRESLVRWMFAAAASHPAVASIANVPPKVMADANTTTGALITRLLTDSCRDRTKKALAYEGTSAMRSSFSVLGQAAASELFSSPEVAKAMSGMQGSLDSKKLEELKAP